MDIIFKLKGLIGITPKGVSYIGYRFYHKENKKVYEVIDIDMILSDERLIIKPVNEYSVYFSKLDSFNNNINNHNYLKCVDVIPTDYTKYLYISKKTNNIYKCVGWNYNSSIYLNFNDSESSPLTISLDDLLENFWVVKKD